MSETWVRSSQNFFRRLHISFTESGAILYATYPSWPDLFRPSTSLRSAEILRRGCPRPADCLDCSTPILLLVGNAFGRPPELKETGMEATRFERRAGVLFAAVALAATTAAFAIGRAEAQTVNPVPPPPPPVFNPSDPSAVPQAPEAPVSPTPPTGLSGSAPAPASPTIEPPPAATPQTATAPAPASPAVVPPAVTSQTAPVLEAAKAAPSRTHAGHHGAVRYRWSRRHVRFHAVRVLGPSYYPGLVEFYPPYANPCHFSPVWSGYYAGLWTSYGCSW